MGWLRALVGKRVKSTVKFTKKCFSVKTPFLFKLHITRSRGSVSLKEKFENMSYSLLRLQLSNLKAQSYSNTPNVHEN